MKVTAVERIFLADLYLDKAEDAARDIAAGGGRAIGVQLDVQRSTEWGSRRCAAQVAVSS